MRTEEQKKESRYNIGPRQMSFIHSNLLSELFTISKSYVKYKFCINRKSLGNIEDVCEFIKERIDKKRNKK